jgi:putative phosphoesterase
MLIAILADTHLPRGQRALPAGCVEWLRAAELIIHAGDFTRFEVLRQLETYGRVIAVHGNVDEPALRRALPEQIEIETAPGHTIAVIHDAGPAPGRLRRMRRRFPEADAVIFGHSHMPLHERASDDGQGGEPARPPFQIFNPGSPTDRRRAPHHTMGLARVDPEGRISFELVELD